MIEPIDVNGAAEIAPLNGVKLAGKPQADFTAWLTEQLNSVNEQILQGDEQVRRLAVGDATNLHQVMLSLSKAKMSFELVMQVRNKVLEAYQDIMRMQI